MWAEQSSPLIIRHHQNSFQYTGLFKKTKIAAKVWRFKVMLCQIKDGLRWIWCLSLCLKPPPAPPPHRLIRFMNFLGLFLSVATAVAVHDTTKIFITPGSKSRHADDKHSCLWVSFLWFEIHHMTYAHASPCICDVIYDDDLQQTSTILTDWLSGWVFFFVLLDSTATCQWSTELIRATKTPPSSFTTKPFSSSLSAFEILHVCRLSRISQCTIFTLWFSTIEFSW